MTDITKCTNINCKMKRVCYRFTAESSGSNQSYAEFKPNGDNSCYYFWYEKANKPTKSEKLIK